MIKKEKIEEMELNTKKLYEAINYFKNLDEDDIMIYNDPIEGIDDYLSRSVQDELIKEVAEINFDTNIIDQIEEIYKNNKTKDETYNLYLKVFLYLAEIVSYNNLRGGS